MTWLGVAAIVAILVATALATTAAIRYSDRDARSERDAVASAAIRSLAADVEATSATADDLRAFFEASGTVTEDDFARFTAAQVRRMPWIGRIGWTESTREGTLTPRLSAGRAAGDPDPLASPEVAEALRAARDSATPRLSAPVGDTVVMVAPVYTAGSEVDSVQARRAALRGYVSATMEVDALRQAVLAPLQDGVRMSVADDGATVLGDDAGGGSSGAIDVAGRRWQVAVAGVGGASPALPAAVAIAGLLLAGIVALLLAEAAGRERAAQGELARLRERHDLILSSAGDGILSSDRAGVTGFVNPAAAGMLGRDAADITGAAVDATGLPSPAAALERGRPESGEVELTRADGTTFPAEYTTTPISEDGDFVGAVTTFRDITARKRLEARTLQSLAVAEEMAAVDPLTGLANHRTFHDRLRSEVEGALRRGRGVALILMDLDHFKRVNDLHGHQAGDRVLERAAEVLREETRSGELIARVGGEEFAMILPDAAGEEALRAAERVRRAVAATDFPMVGRMTISAGVCDLTRAADADVLYGHADDALYQAKHRGRDRVELYGPGTGSPPSPREEAEDLARRQALVSVRLLARVVDAKHPSTRRHSERVGDLAAEIAEELGWPAERAAQLREAGLVHDVGKIGVPEDLLVSPGPLDPQAYALVQEHSTLGAGIAGDALTPEQVSWVRGHHERWDGTGYPDRLPAEDCPEGARILALAEAWDAMTSERPYTTAPATPAEALAECRDKSGSQFWPAAVDALARLRGGA